MVMEVLDPPVRSGRNTDSQQRVEMNTEMRVDSAEEYPPLNILYLSHYFPPEVNAPAVRVSELMAEWIKKGQRVTVQTGFPNHPSGVIPEGYRGAISRRESMFGGKVFRSYIYATPNKGILKRGIGFLSYMFSTMALSSPRSGPADVVIGTSPQFFVAVAAWVTSVFKRAPFVFEVRDLWPEEIVAVGAIKNKLIIKILEAMEMFLYRRSALIVAVAQGTVDTLIARGIPADKIALIPNGVSIERFSKGDGRKVRDRFGVNGEFLVSYIGTHGMAHRLETVLEAADSLREEKEIKFMMVGDGAEKDRLVALAAEKKLDNVIFVPQAPSQEMPDYYDAADVCLAPLRSVSLFERNIPSKLYEIMASSRPTLLGARGESRKMLESAGAGVAFEPENSSDLVANIKSMFADRASLDDMGRKGREYVTRFHQRESLAEQYLIHLRRIVSERVSSAKGNH